MRKVYLLLSVIFVIVSACAQDDTQEGNQAGNQAVLENTVLDESIPTEPEDLVNEIPKYSDAPTARPTSTSTATQKPTPVVSPTATLDFSSIVDADWMTTARNLQVALQTQQASEGLKSNEGPWLIITTNALGVWASDPDGRGLVQLVKWDGEFNASYGVSPSPRGRDLVIISGADPSFGSPRMYVYNFPYAKLLLDMNLMSDQMIGYWNNWSDYSLVQNLEQAYYATIYGHRWAPDGEKIAFVGALDGDSADVYVYNRGSNSFQRLTTGSTHAVDLVWSPDSNHIIHGAVSSLNAGAAGYGYSDYSVWDVTVSTGSIALLDDGIDYGFEHHLGWVSETTYLADTDEQVRGRYNLRISSLDGRVIAELLCENYAYLDFDPVSKLLVVHPDDFYPEAENCDQFDGSGYYVYRLVENHLELIHKLSDRSDVYIGKPFFEPHHGLFYIPQGDDGYVSINREGEVSSVEIEHPEWSIFNASPDGESYFDGGILAWRGEVIDIESKLPPGVNAYEGIWSPDGEALAFFGSDSDNALVYIAHAPEFEPILVFSFPYTVDSSMTFLPENLFWVGE